MESLSLSERGDCHGDPSSIVGGQSYIVDMNDFSSRVQTPKYGDHYLELYSCPGVHQLMMKDSVRMKTYYNAICHNRHLFKNKIVLDVGCGTGILSLFAAKAGASKVIGVESSSIADSAKQIVVDNKKDHIITIIKGKLEDVELPAGINKVDIIISEFMGYSLFWESMTDTVLFARDKWLKRGGLIFPDVCSLYIIGIWDPFRKDKIIDSWDNFKVRAHYSEMSENLVNPFSKEAKALDTYDMTFNFSDLKNGLLRRPVIYGIGPKQVATEPCLLTTIDLNKVTVDELREMIMPFRMKTTWFGKMHGLATYFTVHFTKCFKDESFSTAPEAPSTHWRQTIFFLRNEITIGKDQFMSGTFSMKKNKRYERDFDMKIIWDYVGGWGNAGKKANHEENFYYSHHF